MTREQHLSYCKICLNRKMDIKKGLVCNLTNEIADFEETCENFKEDSIERKKLDSIPSIQEVESTAKLSNGSQWFIWIFGLSVINTLILYFGGQVSFIFGLGITQLFEGIYIGIFGDLNLLGVIISILISGIFAIIWHFSKNLSKTAFIIGMIIYGIDALILLAFQDWLSSGVHLYALFMIFKGYQSVDELKKEKTFTSNV
ncbi:hypothetical protein ACFQ1R_07370 [Mariniflexile jejuense]|uniref:MerC mercury resistance protein n=1 Tax=Mariniflexile jejuense TaxID=1173582 RepID=A0ABW3JHD9_9FLAO